MKKPLVVTSIGIMLIIILVVIYFNNRSSDEFKIPENTRYTLIYSTSKDQKEKSQISYLNNNGKEIGKNIVNNVINSNGMGYNPISNEYNIFTHDEVYFDGKKSESIINKEMKDIYNFASYDGHDEVYASGYLEKLDMIYKHIPHGLSYSEEELGSFDLMTLYNNKKTYNIRIAQSGSIASNQETGTLYNFTGEDGDTILFDRIVYEKNKDEFSLTKGKIDITNFINEEKLNNKTFFLGKTLSLDDKIYQIIHFGEGNLETYLVEYSIDFEKNNIKYQNNFPLDLKEGETISIDTIATINKDEIKYYSPIMPSKLITFNLRSENFDYIGFPDTKSSEGENPFIVKIIEGNIFILESDMENNLFKIYEVDETDSFKKIIESELPNSKTFFDGWIIDFHVLKS